MFVRFPGPGSDSVALRAFRFGLGRRHSSSSAMPFFAYSASVMPRTASRLGDRRRRGSGSGRPAGRSPAPGVMPRTASGIGDRRRRRASGSGRPAGRSPAPGVMHERHRRSGIVVVGERAGMAAGQVSVERTASQHAIAVVIGTARRIPMLPTIVRTTSTATISSLTLNPTDSIWRASRTRSGRAAPR